MNLAFYGANSVLSLVGVALIYWANRIIATSSQVKTNWAQYVLHVCALTLLTVLTLLEFISDNNAEYIAGIVLEASLNICLCYIVWS